MVENFGLAEAAQAAGLTEDEFINELFRTVTAVMMSGEHLELQYSIETTDGDKLTLTVSLSREET